jgi:hypothetical protein
MEHIPLNVGKIEQPNKKTNEQIKTTAARLFVVLGGKGILDRWGDAIGEPNPDMKEFLPHKMTRKEREEKKTDPQPSMPEPDPGQAAKVTAEIRQVIGSWKSEHEDYTDDDAVRVWEEMIGHLMGRGRTRLHDVILKSLYELEN